jgi:ribosomal protein S3AE
LLEGTKIDNQLLYRRLSAKNAKLLRPTLFNYIATEEEFKQYTEELFSFIIKDKMNAHIYKIYPLEQVAKAHEVRSHDPLRHGRSLPNSYTRIWKAERQLGSFY